MKYLLDTHTLIWFLTGTETKGKLLEEIAAALGETLKVEIVEKS